MSAARKTSARLPPIFAPLETCAAAGWPAPTPAPGSTKASSPAVVRFGTTTGTNATRRSPGKLSRGTPTIMKFPPGPKPLTYGIAHYRRDAPKRFQLRSTPPDQPFRVYTPSKALGKGAKTRCRVILAHAFVAEENSPAP